MTIKEMIFNQGIQIAKCARQRIVNMFVFILQVGVSPLQFLQSQHVCVMDIDSVWRLGDAR